MTPAPRNPTEPVSLPRTGPLPRPDHPQEARAVLKAESFPSPDVQRITLEVVEFTSICPRTGQPDFGTVTIEYEPDERCLESKSVKYYLWSYRNEGAFCEDLAARIANDIVFAIAPAWVKVTVEQNLRGGIGIVAEAERSGRT